MALFGQRISGADAVRLGLAWTAVGADAVDETARELAAVPAADPQREPRTREPLSWAWSPETAR